MHPIFAACTKNGVVQVMESCSAEAGRHVCLTHKFVAMNYLDLAGHEESPGPHELAWLCTEHNQIERY